MTATNIKIKILKTQEIINDLKKQISIEVENLPDNPEIKRVNNKCYLINRSVIERDKNKNMSPYYYDFIYQYRLISRIVQNCKSDDILRRMEQIIATGKYRETGGNYFKFHPKVIGHIKTLL